MTDEAFESSIPIPDELKGTVVVTAIDKIYSWSRRNSARYRSESSVVSCSRLMRRVISVMSRKVMTTYRSVPSAEKIGLAVTRSFRPSRVV